MKIKVQSQILKPKAKFKDSKLFSSFDLRFDIWSLIFDIFLRRWGLIAGIPVEKFEAVVENALQDGRSQMGHPSTPEEVLQHEKELKAITSLIAVWWFAFP